MFHFIIRNSSAPEVHKDYYSLLWSPENLVVLYFIFRFSTNLKLICEGCEVPFTSGVQVLFIPSGYSVDKVSFMGKDHPFSRATQHQVCHKFSVSGRFLDCILFHCSICTSFHLFQISLYTESWYLVIKSSKFNLIVILFFCITIYILDLWIMSTYEKLQVFFGGRARECIKSMDQYILSLPILF